MKLTKSAIERFTFSGKTPGSKDLRWDDEVKGFGVRVWPTGALSYFVIYRHLGRERYMSLGAYELRSLDDVRNEARRVKLAVLAGKDPLADKRRRAESKAFGDLLGAFEDRRMPHLRPATRKLYRSLIRGYLEPWRDRRLPTITKVDVTALKDEIGAEHTVTANAVLKLLCAMFRLAAEWGLVPETHKNPAVGIKRFQETPRQRFVTIDEMPRLLASIEESKSRVARVAIWMYLLTGLRKSEVLRIRWADVDWKARFIRIPKTKTTPTMVPLTTHMEQALKTMPKVRGNPYVFANVGTETNVKGIDYAWDTIRSRAGLADVRLHDLRHTVASWLVSSGASLALVGRVLNHKNPAMTQRYSHFEKVSVATALESHGQALLVAAGHSPAPSPSGGDPAASPAS